MKAAVVPRFGPPDVLELRELPRPQPGAGQLLIEVGLISVTFVETQVRAGRGPGPANPTALPYVPGNGVGGVVDEAGAGCDPALRGRRVVSTTGGHGGYAEFALVDAADAIRVPESLDLATATALLADGRTALALVRRAALAPGQRALVLAAAGGVGAALVQLVDASGAEVVAAVGSDAKRDAAAALGAMRVLNYGRTGWSEELEPVDVVFDGVGGAIADAALERVRPGGRFLAYGMASGSFVTNRRPDVEIDVGVRLNRKEIRDFSVQALELAARGELRPLIGQTLPLSEAAAAHASIEARGVHGKTLLVANPALVDGPH